VCVESFRIACGEIDRMMAGWGRGHSGEKGSGGCEDAGSVGIFPLRDAQIQNDGSRIKVGASGFFRLPFTAFRVDGRTMATTRDLSGFFDSTLGVALMTRADDYRLGWSEAASAGLGK
jgi:hypothetical protein